MATENTVSQTEDEQLTDNERNKVDSALDAIDPASFQAWYRERQFRQNIREGKSYFNGPSSVPSPQRHSPSSLLQCHRKILYRQENAPEEDQDAEGILWMGSRVEEDVIVPFLQQTVATDETYVRNSMWIDYTIETDVGDLRIKGVTDPVIVDDQSMPLLPTEVKTTASIEHLDSANDHHRAQLHAYLVGLSREYDRDLTDGILIYVSRETFDLKAFHVRFDTEFWDDVVLHWASNHTEFRLNEALPPAQPEECWECKFCSYRERCGKGETSQADLEPVGFVPGYTDYPRQKVIEHLEAHENAQLTPALAEEFPDVASRHSVQSWQCSNCSTEFGPQKIPSEFEPNQHVLCPVCADRGTLAELRISGSESGGE